ncbi:MAG TPA: 2-C-methyl-D-erythritol 4-phosphate cytidylyltransferase [Thermoleophilaceae bacterium]|nr:2-C-methyl-D-erythritol 4-phosphate cytidylyltransferase [Thermoleophilaceae bacterium]
MSLVGIVPAGGSGERLGAQRPKAFVVLAGRAMLEWSVEVLERVCDRVVVAVPEGYDADDAVPGGPSRSESVRNAIQAAPEAEVYVVHDAARPLLTEELVRRCVDALGDGVDGAIAAAPVTDTIKHTDGQGRVVSTLERSALWAVQTPQVFRAEALRRALDADAAALAGATDDASLVEAAGGRVDVVDSGIENFKVTTPLDLRMAEAVLAERC